MHNAVSIGRSFLRSSKTGVRRSLAVGVFLTAAGIVACGGGVSSAGGAGANPCSASFSRCGDACRNLQTDASNCGACGHICATGAACVAGVCSNGTGGTGGAAGATGGAGGATTDPFQLLWQDDFDSFDGSRWQLQTFSWDGNLAQFSTQNVSVANSILSIHLTPEPSDTVKPYRGVEMRSLSTITYGKVEARVRFAKGSGVVSGLVLIYTPWPADDWNEIDIEHLGKTNAAVQLNCQVYTGPPTTPPVTQSVTPTQDPQMVTLGFDAEADFHVYTIEWTPIDVRFKADGALLRTWSGEIARMKLPQNILFTIWASSTASWAGALTSSSTPTTADIDWIKVYRYAG